MKHKTMQLEFKGQTHSIDANTLVNILIYYQSVVTEANKQLSGGDREVTLKVNALKQGSFVVDVSVAQNIVAQLFSKDTMEYAAALCAVVGGVYQLYKYFKGKPVKTKEDKKAADTILKLGDNVNITVNIYNEQPVRQAVSKSMETANNDPSVEGFTIKDEDGGKCAEFDRKEFDEYIYDGFDAEESQPEERIEEEITTLVIVGLNFERGSRWQFIYNGFKISMIVKDDALMQKIDEGERFGKGDSIKVKLRRLQKYNKEYGAYENKSYRIVEFLEHLIPPKPKNMFDEN